MTPIQIAGLVTSAWTSAMASSVGLLVSLERWTAKLPTGEFQETGEKTNNPVGHRPSPTLRGFRTHDTRPLS